MLYFVLNACEFLFINVLFLVEHAIKRNKKMRKKLYLRVFFFNRTDFKALTSKKHF